MSYEKDDLVESWIDGYTHKKNLEKAKELLKEAKDKIKKLKLVKVYIPTYNTTFEVREDVFNKKGIDHYETIIKNSKKGNRFIHRSKPELSDNTSDVEREEI